MSAIRIAAEAIAVMKLGRLDAETTANLGIIQGGLAGNIVPAGVTIRGETRSLSLEKLAAQTEHMRRCFDEAAARHRVQVADRQYQARVEAQIDRQYGRLDIRDEAGIVRLVQSAAGAMGRACATRGTGGGSDANVFVERGLEVANLACGMREIHTVNEWVDVRDLGLTAGLLVETVRLNAAA
jgi:tripeptide aminopeptidase